MKSFWKIIVLGCLSMTACAGTPKERTMDVEPVTQTQTIEDVSVPANAGMPKHLTYKMSNNERPERLLFVVPWYGDNPESHANYFVNTLFGAGSFVLQIASSSQKIPDMRNAYCWTDAAKAFSEIQDAWEQSGRFAISADKTIAFGSSQGADPLLELALNGKLEARGFILAVPFITDTPEPFWPHNTAFFLDLVKSSTLSKDTRFVFVSGPKDDYLEGARKVATALETAGFRVLFLEAVGGHTELLPKAANSLFLQALEFIDRP